MAILGTIIAYAGLSLGAAGLLCIEIAWWALPAVVFGALLLIIGSLLSVPEERRRTGTTKTEKEVA